MNQDWVQLTDLNSNVRFRDPHHARPRRLLSASRVKPMIGRTLLFSLLLPLSALAQLQVFQFDGTNDTPVSSLVNVGTASPGDTLETRFHVRNIGAGPASLTNLGLSGQAFTIVSSPSLLTCSRLRRPGFGSRVRCRFQPSQHGSFSAFLDVNSINLLLQGISAASRPHALW